MKPFGSSPCFVLSVDVHLRLSPNNTMLQRLALSPNKEESGQTMKNLGWRGKEQTRKKEMDNKKKEGDTQMGTTTP